MRTTAKNQPKKPPHRPTAGDGAAVSSSVLAELAALKDAPAPALKARWRELFDAEPPPYNRRFLESRLAYRIQELAYGGLKPETWNAEGSWQAIRRQAAGQVPKRAGSTACRSRARG